MSDPTGFVVPDLVEPVTGYRSWTVRIHPDGEPRLSSPYRRSVWTPGEACTAVCSAQLVATAVGMRSVRPSPGGAHPAPGEGCTCGVHAWRTRAAALADAAGTRGLRAVSGEVDLWGALIRHERGWRAAFGYPRSMTVHPATTDGLCFVFSWEAGELRAIPAAELAPALTRAYGVPVAIDPGDDPLGPRPRHAPSAQRMPRARLGPDGVEAARLERRPFGDRLLRWLTQAG